MTIPNQQERLCAYAVLRKQFTAISRGQFDVDNHTELDTIQNDKKYNKALKAVETLGQWGNFDLWLHLPETMPRKVPKCYKSRFIYGVLNYPNIIPIETIFLLHPRFIIHCPSSFIENILNILICILPFTAIYTIITLVISTCSILMYLLACIELLLFPIRNLFRWITRDRILPFYRACYILAADDACIDDDIEIILTKGRKAIANITNIEYLGVDPESTEIINIQDDSLFNSNEKSDHCTSIYTTSYPKFKLTYVFNPPDDGSEQDLTHYVILPFDPGKKLRIGDMLPILYYISTQNNADVMSMPFPLPLKQIRKYGEIYYHHGTTDVTHQ